MAYYYYPHGQQVQQIPSMHIPSMRSPAISNQKTFNDMSRVIQPKGDRGGLYIGNISCAQSPVLIKMHNIGAVVTIDNSNTSVRFDKNSMKQHFVMPVTETSSINSIFKYMDGTIDFIANALKNTNVMVHCHSGLRLSSAVAIGYLMKHKDLTAENAYAHVKQCRSVTKIEKDLFVKLKQYQSQCRFPKQNYNLPKVEQLFESTYTDDSEDHTSLSYLAPLITDVIPTQKPNNIQLTQSYQGYF